MTEPLNPGDELSIFNADTFKIQLLEAISSADETSVELSDVEDIDSCGLQLLLAAKKFAQIEGKALHFIHHSPAVIQAIETAALESVLGDPILYSKGPADD